MPSFQYLEKGLFAKTPPPTDGTFKVVLEGYGRCPDSHDQSECHHLYDLPLLAAKNLLPPISLTVLTLTPKKYLKQPSGTTLKCHCTFYIYGVLGACIYKGILELLTRKQLIIPFWYRFKYKMHISVKNQCSG